MGGKTIIALNYKDLAYAKQTDDGAWSTGTAAIGHRTVALAVDPYQPERIYVGTDGHGILRTEDYGETWTPAGLEGQSLDGPGVGGGKAKEESGDREEAGDRGDEEAVFHGGMPRLRYGILTQLARVAIVPSRAGNVKARRVVHRPSTSETLAAASCRNRALCPSCCS